MKKRFFLIPLFLLFVFTSCENFLEGQDVSKAITDAIDYANAQYVDVNITSQTDATKNIVPAGGN